MSVAALQFPQDPDTAEPDPRRWRSRLLPAIIALAAVLVVTAALWPVRVWYRAHLERTERAEVDDQLAAVAAVLSADLNERLALAQGLAAFVEASPTDEISAHAFETYASSLFSPNHGIRVLQLAPDGIVKFNYPVAGNEASMGRNLLADPDPRLLQQVQEAIETRRMVVSRPTPLWQGGFGTVVRQAVFRQDRFWGLVIVVLDSPQIIADAQKTRGSRLEIAIRDDLGQVFSGSPAVFDHKPVRAITQLPGKRWELAGIPRGGWKAPGGSALLIFRLFMYGTILLIGVIAYLIASRQVWLKQAVVDRTKSLQRARERFDAAVRGANDGLWHWEIGPDESDRGPVYWSPRLKELLGYQDHELSGSWQEWRSRIHPDDVAHMLESVRRHLEERVPFREEYRLRHRDGDYRWFLARAQAVWDETTGKAVRMSGGLTDVTDRKKAEEDLRKSEATFRRLAESATAMICVIENRKITYANPFASTMTGYNREELVGRRFVDFVRPDLRPWIEQRLADYDAGGPWPGHFETALLRKDNTERWVEVSSSPDKVNGVTYVTGIAIDITDRRRIAMELDDRLKFEAMVADLSAALVSVAADKVDRAVDDALKRVGQFLDVDRVAMIEYDLDGNTRQILFHSLYDVAKLEAEQSTPLIVKHPWAWQKAASGEPFSFSSLDELPPEAEVDKQSFNKRGTKSVLAVPLPVHGDSRFVITVSMVREERVWADHLMNRLRVMGEVFANALIRGRMHRDLERSTEMLRSLNSELSRTEDRARRNLAAVLHDDLAQNLYGSTAELIALRNASTMDNVRTKLDSVIARLDDSMRQARELTYDLCPPVLYELGLVPALQELAERFTARHGIEFKVGEAPAKLAIDSDLSALLFQSVRELFTNVVKHSRGTKATVTITQDERMLRVTVEDDGVGCGVDTKRINISPSGFGLFNMRERLRSLGGQLRVEAGHTGGCVVHLTIPGYK